MNIVFTILLTNGIIFFKDHNEINKYVENILPHINITISYK